jgi:hypothetical protein
MSSPKLAAAAKPADDVLAPLRDAAADRPFVVAQLGQSLDGRIATSSGESAGSTMNAPSTSACPARGMSTPLLSA